MKNIMSRIAVIMLVVLFLSACEKREIVASVGSEKITAEELMAALAHAGLPASEHNLDLLLGQLIKQRAAERQASNLQLTENLDYQRRVRILALEVLRKRYKQEALEEVDVNVTEADIQTRYQSDKKRFFRPAKVRIALIAFENRGGDTAKEVSSHLENLQNLTGDERDFAFQRLAANHSLDRASRYLGGDIGYLEQGVSSRWPNILVEAAFALETKGRLSSVVATPDSLYLLKLTDRQFAYTEPLDSVRETLRQEILTQKYDELNARIDAKLMAGMPVERNEKLLVALSVPQKNKKPQTLPGPALN